MKYAIALILVLGSGCGKPCHTIEVTQIDGCNGPSPYPMYCDIHWSNGSVGRQEKKGLSVGDKIWIDDENTFCGG